MDNRTFYNSASTFYDEMIDFDASLQRRINLISNIIGNYKTAADLGCGTGIDAIGLSKNGLRVDAFDQSKEMVERAKANASKHDAEIEFFTSSIEEISFQRKYNLMVSLGNTMSNLSEQDLRSSLKNCFFHLDKGGRLVIQVLNYNLVTDDTHVVNETENDLYKVIRYYERNDDGLLFNIKSFNKKDESETTLTTKIYPHKLEVFKEICTSFLLSMRVYGDLELNDFDESASKDLVIIGEKLVL